MKTVFARAFALWLPVAVAFTGVFAFAYVAVQQNYRQSMNDPQLQMAEDGAAFLASDYTPAALVTRGAPLVDLRKSLDPWIAVYDASGLPLESSGVLDAAPPKLPLGLFDTSTWRSHKIFAAPNGPETRVIWQPREDVRQAVVLVQFHSKNGVGYVAAGRSMRTTEERIINLTILAATAWSITILASFAAVFLLLALGWL